jgi:CBS domain-containing protein
MTPNETLTLCDDGEMLDGLVNRFEERAKKAFAATAEQMMTADPLTVGPDEPAEHAARLISEKHHNRLPVVDDEGRLVGVVTRVDVLAALTGD